MKHTMVIDEIRSGYGKGPEIVKGVSLELQFGEFHCILGPNGCGKTTLLKSILGLMPVRTGSVLCEGSNLLQLREPERAKQVAYIPQAHRPPFPFSVKDVVRMGRTPHLSRLSFETETDRNIAGLCMDRLGIRSLSDRPYTELSGGQQQLVLIARALAQQAHFLVMDEPTSSLDYGNQYRVLAQIRRLCNEMNLGVLMVTHDPAHCFYVADRVHLMQDGIITDAGTPEKVIDSVILSRLYDFPIRIHPLQTEEFVEMVCIPTKVYK